MLYYLSYVPIWLRQQGHEGLADAFSFFRVFEYVTFRAAGAAVTALMFSIVFGPRFIRWLRSLKVQQEYEDRARVIGGMTGDNVSKRGVPTMGGLLIVIALDLSALLWAQCNLQVTLTLVSVIVLALLGFYDDYSKIMQQEAAGLTERIKLFVQTTLAFVIGIFLWQMPETTRLITEVMVPFYKQPILIGAGLVGLLVTILAIVGSSNAVNLTDGLDGLAVGSTVMVSFVLLVFTYIAGHVEYAKHLNVPHIVGAGELSVVCAALIGASLGFLWFNCHPAMMFMGDTGALALGGALGIIAVLIHQPFILVIAGGVFVLEAGSVLLQRSWFKYTRHKTGTGQRIFLMAPLHHHFQKKSWHENQVVIRFYILGILFAVMALATLKLR